MKRSEFKLPELKVGTLDSLIQLSDELAKADTYGESVSRKVATYFADILDNDRAQLKEHLKLANNIDPNGKNFKGSLDPSHFYFFKSMSERVGSDLQRR